MKECKKCHERKPIKDFRVNKKGTIIGRCIECEKEYSRQYYNNNSERINERCKKYRDENRSKVLAYNKAYNNSKRKKR